MQTTSPKNEDEAVSSLSVRLYPNQALQGKNKILIADNCAVEAVKLSDRSVELRVTAPRNIPIDRPPVRAQKIASGDHVPGVVAFVKAGAF